MNFGDLIYQLMMFLVMIGMIAGIVFIVKFFRRNLLLKKEMNSKLDRLLEDKQK